MKKNFDIIWRIRINCFWNYLKDLTKANQIKKEQVINQVNDELIDLRNIVIKKEITEYENSNNIIVGIAEKKLITLKVHSQDWDNYW